MNMESMLFFMLDPATNLQAANWLFENMDSPDEFFVQINVTNPNKFSHNHLHPRA